MAYKIYCFAPFELRNSSITAANSTSITAKIISVLGVLWVVGHGVVNIDGDVGGGTIGGGADVLWFID